MPERRLDGRIHAVLLDYEYAPRCVFEIKSGNVLYRQLPLRQLFATQNTLYLIVFVGFIFINYFLKLSTQLSKLSVKATTKVTKDLLEIVSVQTLTFRINGTE